MSLVLIVDDDRDIRETTQLLLEEHGHRVICAANGQEALHLMQQGPRPDFVVLDLMMPVMSGWELREQMLGDPALATIPTIVISGDTKAVQRRDDLRVDGYLSKPFELDDLLGQISDVGQPGPDR